MGKRYYVSIPGRSVLEEQGATAYEWTIEASSEEAINLRYMLERIGEKEDSSFVAYMYPWPDTPEDVVNSGYQSQIDKVYREIYRLGTEETRRELERIGYGNGVEDKHQLQNNEVRRNMYYIKEAKFRRLAEHDGRECAEIQVWPGAAGDPELFVYVARSQNGNEDYEIIRMIRSDADFEIDWYDNSLHEAYAEIAEENFGDTGWPEPAKQRADFKEQLLAYGDIADKLREKLSGENGQH